MIHKLLEAAMNKEVTDEDLLTLAETFLTEEELSAEHTPAAVKIVKSVTSSDLWKKAQNAPQRFTEIPYTRTYERDRVETLETGVMDLVFEEEDGWVIVDYKTGGKDRDYSEQLNAYREAWESFGQGKVKEVGIYFVDHDKYVEI